MVRGVFILFDTSDNSLVYISYLGVPRFTARVISVHSIRVEFTFSSTSIKPMGQKDPAVHFRCVRNESCYYPVVLAQESRFVLKAVAKWIGLNNPKFA